MTIAGFPPHPRFSYRRLIGEGGFGLVFEAHDRERRANVALKVLKRLDADALYRFKAEFRSLADLADPHLVRLHELFSDGETCFFTMELLRGSDFLSHVRPPDEPAPTSIRPRADGTTQLASGPSGSVPRFVAATTLVPPATRKLGPAERSPFAQSVSDATAEGDIAASSRSRVARRLDLRRLRAALGQLARGLSVLHDRGQIHRDIKPSNVLVTDEGRVAILDFGLVTSLGPDARAEHALAGTPAYMAPEVWLGSPLTPAVDWYAVGVMLFEAATGELPFENKPFRAVLDKLRPPPLPSALFQDAPRWLDEMCAALLSPEPSVRPDGDEILRRLGAPPAPRRVSFAPHRTTATPLFGREPHLEKLHAALAEALSGHAVTVHVRGASGMGKTSLVRRFLEDVAAAPGALVLKGACYEREALPYKAIDPVMDMLSLHLSEMTASEAESLLPEDIGALLRLFPVLGRASAVARAVRPDGMDGLPSRRAAPEDAQELRRRGFLALRELLLRLGEQRTLVVHIDDLQWGDADSAALLSEVLRPPGAPPLLFVLSYRGEDVGESELLRSLSPWVAGSGPTASHVHHIEVGPLSPSEAEALSRWTLGASDHGRSRAIVEESAGCPFWVAELSSAAAEREPLSRRAPSTSHLRDLLRERLLRLGDSSARILHVVSVAGRPLARAIVEASAGLDPATIRDQTAILCDARLLRTRGSPGHEELLTYHDRVREEVVSALAPEALAEVNLRIARTLESTGGAEPHHLFTHYRNGGDRSKAARYAVLAGDRAALALAFERAATLYRAALDLGAGEGSNEERVSLLARTGQALAYAGRGREAAAVYLEASRRRTGDESLDLRRLAAENLLRSGYIDEGFGHLTEVLSAVGLEPPKSPLRTLAALVARRAQVDLRGLKFRARKASEIPAAELRRIDVCWSASIGLGMVDPIRGAYFQARGLLFALAAGDPYRIARVLAIAVPFIATEGPKTRSKTASLVQALGRIAAQSRHPHALSLVPTMRGIALFLEARFTEAMPLLSEGESRLRSDCVDVSWEIGSVTSFSLWACWWTGKLGALARRTMEAIFDAEERGDRYFATNLGSGVTNAAWLVRGDPAAARAVAEKAIGGWSNASFRLQHYFDLVARAQLDLYLGEPEKAHGHLCEGWSGLTHSLNMRVYTLRVTCHYLRALAALSALRDDPGKRAYLEDAERFIAELRREGEAWASALAELLFAARLALTKAPSSRVMARFEEAEALLAAVGLSSYSAAARVRLGEATGGEEGARIRAEGVAYFEREGVADPDRMIQVLAPRI